jgi:hypothetical protein
MMPDPVNWKIDLDRLPTNTLVAHAPARQGRFHNEDPDRHPR